MTPRTTLHCGAGNMLLASYGLSVSDKQGRTFMVQIFPIWTQTLFSCCSTEINYGAFTLQRYYAKSIEIIPTNAQIWFIWHKLAYMFRPSMAIIRALHTNTENTSLSI
jgi:hypothetical protein